jgi:hypothetical protein
MSQDKLLKKLQSLKDLRQAIDLIRNEGLEKAVPKAATPAMQPHQQIKQQGQQEVQAQNLSQIGLKHIGVDTQKSPGVISHMVGFQGGNKPHHYAIDVNMNHLDSKIPAYTVHKVHSGTGQAIESAPKAHKNIQSAVKSLFSHATTGSWGEE